MTTDKLNKVADAIIESGDLKTKKRFCVIDDKVSVDSLSLAGKIDKVLHTGLSAGLMDGKRKKITMDQMKEFLMSDYGSEITFHELDYLMSID